ncbi:MAG: hypothetical protein ABIG66_05640 [Candidatus Kerfeldbacteria bacterium]
MSPTSEEVQVILGLAELDELFSNPPGRPRAFRIWINDRIDLARIFFPEFALLERLPQDFANPCEVSIIACRLLRSVQQCIKIMRPADGSYLPSPVLTDLYGLKVHLLTLIVMMDQRDVGWRFGIPGDGNLRGLTVGLMCAALSEDETYWHWPRSLIPVRVQERILEAQGEYPPTNKIDWENWR